MKILNFIFKKTFRAVSKKMAPKKVIKKKTLKPRPKGRPKYRDGPRTCECNCPNGRSIQGPNQMYAHRQTRVHKRRELMNLISEANNWRVNEPVRKFRRTFSEKSKNLIKNRKCSQKSKFSQQSKI